MPNPGFLPVPVFMDVDGSLLAYPESGSAEPRLITRRLEFDLSDASGYPRIVRFDPAVIAELNLLVAEGLIQLIWASTWDESANHYLLSALGLEGGPFEVAIVGTRYGDQMAAGVWIKARAVGRWLQSNRTEDGPIVMVDDLLADQANGFMSPQRRSIDAVAGPGSLLLATDSIRGVLPSQVAEIRAYAERLASGTDTGTSSQVVLPFVSGWGVRQGTQYASLTRADLDLLMSGGEVELDVLDEYTLRLTYDASAPARPHPVADLDDEFFHEPRAWYPYKPGEWLTPIGEIADGFADLDYLRTTISRLGFAVSGRHPEDGFPDGAVITDDVPAIRGALSAEDRGE
ncbi:HAD domain-containing protein [Cryobacterium sp. GrIS_2_6]|uniref:HAD domain-containing protein n=1 Tax=Cryobacterium sp. GrIS_2_6 TaxID=3162785 RepID=UPI002DFCEC85|nr:hypothetical protein [Cryobacterium psychrotolerans]